MKMHWLKMSAIDMPSSGGIGEPMSLSRYSTESKSLSSRFSNAETWSKEDWSKPLNIIAIVVVVSIIAVLIVWWFFHVDFETSGSLAELGWPSMKGGILLFLLFLTAIGGSASTLALSYQENGRASFFGVIAVILLSFLFGLSLKFAKEHDASTFVFFIALAMVLCLVMTAYGIKELYYETSQRPTQPDKTYFDKLAHYNTSKWSAATSVLSCIGLIFASIPIYRHIAGG